MPRPLLIAGIAVLCLPMLFVGWLFLAVKWQRMDAITMHAPGSLRNAVAEVALRDAGYGKAGQPSVDRILRLDPANGGAWERRCSNSVDSGGFATDIDACKAAVRLAHDAASFYWLGTAQERINSPCEAEESYTTASSMSSSYASYTYVGGMGRAALHCNHLPAARAGFETALQLEQKELDGGDEEVDEVAGLKKIMLTDREYLIVVYQKVHEDALAAQTCTMAHPGWKHCACDLDGEGKAVCHQK